MQKQIVKQKSEEQHGEADAIKQVAEAKAQEIAMVYEAMMESNPDEKLVQLSTLKLDEFKEIKVNYSKLTFLEDRTKLIGIKKDSNLLEVFNIPNNSVETLIKLDSKLSKHKIFVKDNI